MAAFGTGGGVRLGACLGAVALLLAGRAPAPAAAQENQPKKPTYDVSVWAIRATTSNTDISPELRPIAAELRRQGKYTGFRLERRVAGQAAEGQTFGADLPAGFTARVTPVEREAGRVRLRIEVARREGEKDKPLLNTTVGLERGKFHLQGGWKLDSRSDDVLIIAVSAR